MDKKGLVIIFTKEADVTLDDIMGKYKLRETDDEILNYKAGYTPKVVIIDRLTQDFVKEKISTEEFLNRLHADLNISPETTKMLAKDIIQDLIPLLDKVPEGKLEEYNTKKDEGKGAQEGALAQEILKKINAKRDIPVAEPETKENPVAKVPTTNVEENAKQIQQIKKDLTPPKAPSLDPNPPINEPAAPARSFEKAKEKLAENKFANEKKGPDDYREPIE